MLSKGVEQLGVPDVQGARRADAERALTSAGFTPDVTEVFSEDVAKGRVADQSPSSGRAAARVAGRARGEQGARARRRPRRRRARTATPPRRALEAAGLTGRVIAIPGPGRVRSTAPGAGEQVRKGSRVTLYVF